MKKSYHHGNLRAVLLENTHKTVSKGGYNSFSLRGLAEDSEVSHTAVYRHFPSKEALMAEVAAEAFKKMAKTAADKVAKVKDPVKKAETCAEAYLDFALANKRVYKLMFGQDSQEFMQYDSYKNSHTEAYGLLLDVVQEMKSAGKLKEPKVLYAAASAWATLHGFTDLAVDGRLNAAWSGYAKSTGAKSTRLDLKDLKKKIIKDTVKCLTS